MSIEQGELSQGHDGSLPQTKFREKTQAYLDQHFKPETLASKIKGLTTAGFRNPVASIEKFPPLASYDINRVKRRLRLIQRLNKKFHLDYKPGGIIETSPQYLSYSKERLFFFLRLGSFYNISENRYRSLISLNPFLVFGELLERGPDSQEEVRRIPYAIRKLSKQEKREEIERVKTLLPNIGGMLENYPDNQRRFFLKLATNLQRQIRA